MYHRKFIPLEATAAGALGGAATLGASGGATGLAETWRRETGGENRNMVVKKMKTE